MNDLFLVFLPVAMIVLMFAVGLRLNPGDIARAFRHPRALLTGVFVQVFALPLSALTIGWASELEPAARTGLLLVAASPGGVTSNYATLLARGSVGLSVAMTLITSSLAPISLPLVLALGNVGGIGAGELWKISLGMTTVALSPLIAGAILFQFAPGVAARLSRVLNPLARLVFLAVVMATFVQNWPAMHTAMASVGLAVCLLALSAPIISGLSARFMGLEAIDARAVMIEASLQNVAITIFVATSLIGTSILAIPGLIYAVLMNFVALGIIGWSRASATTQ